jgi:hypothetical protein
MDGQKTVIADGKSLMTLIEEAFQHLHISTSFKSVEEIIHTDDNSARFIREVLQDEEYQVVKSSGTMYQFRKDRAQHSVLTFFVGLIFLDFCDFRQEIAKKLLDSDETDLVRLWMLTALYHDWGYFSDDVEKADLDFASITKYNLFTDDYADAPWLEPIHHFSEQYPHILAYSYEEIKAYDTYAREYHAEKPKGPECIDHGILGGVKIFDRLVKAISKTPTQDQGKNLVLAKMACLTIAQHNIFKSSKPELDQNYGEKLKKLHFASSFRISMDTPLLLMMSLVDTFECIKRFGKVENKHSNLWKATILHSITVQVQPHCITVNYAELAKRIQSKNEELQNCFKDYKEKICGLDTWTVLLANEDTTNLIPIRHRE